MSRAPAWVAAVVFDLDGLIVDTETPVVRSWEELYAEHGQELDRQRWRDIVGTIGRIDPLEDLEQMLGRALDRDAIGARRRRREEELLERTTPLPGVVDRIAEAQELGLALGIASSSSTSWVRSHLERLGLADRFAAMACADGDPERAKPSATTYLEVCRELDTDPAAAVAIEDSPHGVEAARAAGLACIAVPNELTAPLDLSRAELVVGSLADHTLVELLDRLPRP